MERSNMLKKNVIFFIFLIDAVLAIYVGLNALNKDLLSKLNIPTLSGNIPIFILTISTIILISFLFLLGKLYTDIGEKVDFNEFGIRKKNAKRKLSSYNREMIEARQFAEMERIINKASLDKATHKGSKNPEEDMKKLIGLEEAKKAINRMKARMEFEMSAKKHIANKEMLHMVFYGSPGTGKTTMARIVTGFLYDYGYIKQNKVIEIDGNFLKSHNTSDTERKVKIILNRAYGGVLFIDEAYVLTQNDIIGKQALATLLKEMEDNADKFVVIFAGYTNDMKKMLDTNSGLRSRIKEYIYFPDYDISDLRLIAIMIAGEKGFSISAEAFDNFDLRMAEERKQVSWGNGRTVRNVIEESINTHAYNFTAGSVEKKDSFKLLDCDISIKLPKRI